MLMTNNALLSALVYGPPTAQTQQYFQQQVQSLQNVINTTGATDSFFANVGTLYQQLEAANVTQIAKSMLMRMETTAMPDIIRPLYHLHDFQSAGGTMIDYVMANPIARQAWLDHRIEGYGAAYNPTDTTNVGVMHYEYRMATDGVVMQKGDMMMSQHYHHTLKDGDTKLLPMEQAAIIATWEMLELHIKAGLEDPTSPVGNSM